MGQLFCRKPSQELKRSAVFLNNAAPVQAFFFPNKDNEKVLVHHLMQATKTILICVYTITNKNILLPLLELTKKKPMLSIRIISDDYQTLGSSQKALLLRLQEEGKKSISIKLDTSMNSCMHNKYAIIDNEIVITGSFNWTSKAVSTNRENIVIIRDRKIAADFTHNFDLLWTIFLPMNDRLEQQQQEKDKKDQKKQAKSPSAKDPDMKSKPAPIKKAIKKQKPKRKVKVINSSDEEFNPETSLDSSIESDVERQ